jgi:membrane fusion protein, multidrug efflux system
MAWMKGFFKKKKVIIPLILLIIFFVWRGFSINSKKTASDFAVAKLADIKEELTLSGKISAQDYVTLNFKTPGKVDWVGVKEGDWVKKGQAIASLKKDVLEAALRQAWQSFTAAKAASDKYYDGRKGKNEESYDEKITRTALDATQNIAYDNTRIAQDNLDSAVLYSPFEGLVISADPEVAGENVAGLNSGYEIVNPSTIYLKVTADQTEVGSLRKGEVGTIIFDSYLEEQTKGTVENISFTPSKDESGTAYDVKVTLDNVSDKDYKYRLGMTADINFIINEKKNVIVIPLSYVNSDDNGKYVLVGDDKKKTYVTTGVENEQSVEITKGLTEGQTVYGI